MDSRVYNATKNISSIIGGNSVVNRRIRYLLGNMNTASFVATDSFGKTQPACPLRPITSLAGATAAPLSSWKMAS